MITLYLTRGAIPWRRYTVFWLCGKSGAINPMSNQSHAVRMYAVFCLQDNFYLTRWTNPLCRYTFFWLYGKSGTLNPTSNQSHGLGLQRIYIYIYILQNERCWVQFFSWEDPPQHSNNMFAKKCYSPTIYCTPVPYRRTPQTSIVERLKHLS